MNRQLLLLLRWGRWQLMPWIKVGAATIEFVCNPSATHTRQSLNANLARINLIAIVEGFQEILDDLPLWFY